ncbi:MAG TPA: hypothetical protein VFI34_06265 [Candidatus Limnocylindrales bacterium]|nr:hypothetical protein [Candidatus Limnocylindrales bacterium]
MQHRTRALVLALAVAALIPVSAAPARAAGPSPDQLQRAGWTCIQPRLDPTQLLCFSPGVGLPPLPGTPGFADRLPSYENLVFDFQTGALRGTQHLLRPDIYEAGKPPCPQQPGSQYLYNVRNDLWFCNRLG